MIWDICKWNTASYGSCITSASAQFFLNPRFFFSPAMADPAWFDLRSAALLRSTSMRSSGVCVPPWLILSHSGCTAPRFQMQQMLGSSCHSRWEQLPFSIPSEVIRRMSNWLCVQSQAAVIIITWAWLTFGFFTHKTVQRQSQHIEGNSLMPSSTDLPSCHYCANKMGKQGDICVFPFWHVGVFPKLWRITWR